MSRPMKWRKVCSLPKNDRFGPLGVAVSDQDFIKMRVDEYETIRLIDFEGLTQAQCAEQMNVARTTVQAMYSSARVKLSKSLVLNKGIVIVGGEYRLCDGSGQGCGSNCQHHNKHRKQRMRDGKGPHRGQGFRK